jgi:uncharacterized protein (TIGR02246 family)
VRGAWTLAPVALLAATAASAQDAVVRALVDRFEAARRDHDPAALARTLAPDYQEISPIGEVDTREQVLGFYAPELKQPAPPMTNDEVAVRIAGDLAIVTQRTSIAIPGRPARAMRIRYVARRTGAAWLLVSAQYTPIPPPRPAAPPAG